MHKVSKEYHSGSESPYHYEVYKDRDVVTTVELGDSAWVVNNGKIYTLRGRTVLADKELIVIIRGFSPTARSAEFAKGSHCNLPYINGCMSENLIAPQRPGDPCAQLLYLPPQSAEQEHHIHSTDRVVYVISGEGVGVVDPYPESDWVQLLRKDVYVIPKGMPHHFETLANPLLVLPIHIWSSTADEHTHPMTLGTFLT